MTEKHIWKNGETITADLLNGMSDYADEKVDAIPKIDPSTLGYRMAGVNYFSYTDWLNSSVVDVTNASINVVKIQLAANTVYTLSTTYHSDSQAADLFITSNLSQGVSTANCGVYDNQPRSFETDATGVLGVAIRKSAQSAISLAHTMLAFGDKAQPWVPAVGDAVRLVGGQLPDENGNVDLSYMAEKANVMLLHHENMAPGTDIHTITEPGFYNINGVANLVNAPASVATSSHKYWGQLEVNNLGGFISHKWLNNNGQFVIETLAFSQSVWSDWHEVTTTIVH